MSHSSTRLVAVLFAGLLVSSLLVAPLAAATDRDGHEPTANGADEERHDAETDDDRATEEDDTTTDEDTDTDENAERARANGRKTVKARYAVDDGDDWGDDEVAAARPWISVRIYPNGTVVIVIDPWGDDDDGANDGGGNGDDAGHTVGHRDAHNVEVNATVRERTEYDDLTMSRGAKQGEMMLVERGYVGGTEVPAREVTGR